MGNLDEKDCREMLKVLKKVLIKKFNFAIT